VVSKGLHRIETSRADSSSVSFPVYTPLVDQAAHKYGPSSSQTTAALREADSFVRSLQSTISAYNATHLVDLVVVSDHGMTTTSNDKLIYLDEILGEDLLNQIYAIDGWPSAGLHFKGASEKEQEASLDRAEKLLKEAAMTVGAGKAFWVYRKEELPVRWRIKENRRIAPLWVVPKLPWSITSKDEMKSFNGQYEPVG
jgi:predicted AlkP superfamily pyrophosphatase or phosphodiesterase